MPKNAIRLIATSLAASVGVACAAPTAQQEPALDVQQLVVAIPLPDSVLAVFHSGIPDRRHLVIRSADEWAVLWREATATIHPAPPVPAFDFTREMLLVATMGARPSGGFAIAIDSVYRRSERLYTVVRETLPAHGCGLTGAITTPAVAVRVPLTSAPVEFRIRSATHTCLW